jgi:elongation factor Ts
MTEITAAQVKELRDATSAGMMECKRALQETSGDFDEAVKLLREKGMASAAKRADRETSEGKVGVMVRGSIGAIAAIGCETEPVSNNDDFLAYAEQVLTTVFEGGDAASDEAERVALAAKLGENIQVAGAKRMEATRCSPSTCMPRQTRSARSCRRRAGTPRWPAALRCT